MLRFWRAKWRCQGGWERNGREGEMLLWWGGGGSAGRAARGRAALLDV